MLRRPGIMGVGVETNTKPEIVYPTEKDIFRSLLKKPVGYSMEGYFLICFNNENFPKMIETILTLLMFLQNLAITDTG